MWLTNAHAPEGNLALMYEISNEPYVGNTVAIARFGFRRGNSHLSLTARKSDFCVESCHPDRDHHVSRIGPSSIAKPALFSIDLLPAF
jgi:hypothetical protein